MKGSGPGGQHRNKTESAVRARHLATGLSVTIDGRDQSRNKEMALQILKQKVVDYEASIHRDNTRQKKLLQYGGGSRSDKIRTYNFMDNTTTDHRLYIKTTTTDVIKKGKFEVFYENNK